jgi:hypothetical protein
MASDGAGAHTTGTRAHDVAVGVASPYWMMAGSSASASEHRFAEQLALNQNSPPAF